MTLLYILTAKSSSIADLQIHNEPLCRSGHFGKCLGRLDENRVERGDMSLSITRKGPLCSSLRWEDLFNLVRRFDKLS